jgi:hypothetical protein
MIKNDIINIFAYLSICLALITLISGIIFSPIMIYEKLLAIALVCFVVAFILFLIQDGNTFMGEKSR